MHGRQGMAVLGLTHQHHLPPRGHAGPCCVTLQIGACRLSPPVSCVLASGLRLLPGREGEPASGTDRGWLSMPPRHCPPSAHCHHNGNPSPEAWPVRTIALCCIVHTRCMHRCACGMQTSDNLCAPTWPQHAQHPRGTTLDWQATFLHPAPKPALRACRLQADWERRPGPSRLSSPAASPQEACDLPCAQYRPPGRPAASLPAPLLCRGPPRCWPCALYWAKLRVEGLGPGARPFDPFTMHAAGCEVLAQ